MASRESALIDITPEVLLKAYSCGIFPMAESAEDPALYWIEPERRGVIPLDRFHVPDRLARTVRSDRFTVAVDRDFDAVIDGCAEPAPGRTRTWINTRIRNLYRKLYERGDCHTVEVYEAMRSSAASMASVSAAPFSARACSTPSATRRRLRSCIWSRGSRPAHYRLLDTQFVTAHLKTFGAVEVPRPAYHKLLDAALVGEGDFAALPTDRPVPAKPLSRVLPSDDGVGRGRAS